MWPEFGLASQATRRSAHPAARGRKIAGDSLLLSRLRALRRAGIVADLPPEANCHGDVTVVHGDHRHLLSRGPVRDSETPHVWLGKKNKEEEESQQWCLSNTMWLKWIYDLKDELGGFLVRENAPLFVKWLPRWPLSKAENPKMQKKKTCQGQRSE